MNVKDSIKLAVVTALLAAISSFAIPRILKRKDVRPNLLETTTQLATYYGIKLGKDNHLALYSRLIQINTFELQNGVTAEVRTDMERQLKTFVEFRNDATTKSTEYLDKIATTQGKVKALLVDLKRCYLFDDITADIETFLKNHIDAKYLHDYETLTKEQCFEIEKALIKQIEEQSTLDQAELDKLIFKINDDLSVFGR